MLSSLIAHQIASFPLTLRRRNDLLSGGEVWTVNFTSFNASGWYRLLLPGLGVSAAFQVSPSALNQAAWHSCRSLYYQRSGTALVAPYASAPWLRTLDHEFSTTGGRQVHLSR